MIDGKQELTSRDFWKAVIRFVNMLLLFFL